MDCTLIAHLFKCCPEVRKSTPRANREARAMVKRNILVAIDLAMKSYQMRQVSPLVYYSNAACPFTCMKNKFMRERSRKPSLQ